MIIKELANLAYIFNTIFTEEACNEISEEFGYRLWFKHWHHSGREFVIFNRNLETFDNGNLAHLRPNLDKWIKDTIETHIAPRGYRLVKI